MMIEIDIPGWKQLRLTDLVLDVNGTLTRDGEVHSGVTQRLALLRRDLRLHLLSADTLGRLDEIAAQLDVPSTRLEPGRPESEQKARFVEQLGAAHVVAVGNGANDVGMLRAAAVGIAVMGVEGLAIELFDAADVLAGSVLDAVDMLLVPSRLIATLRR
jgi:P-type E1-E2 ATPase